METEEKKVSEQSTETEAARPVSKEKQEFIDTLNAAIASGKFLITISWKAKAKPPDDLKHYYKMRNYPTDEIKNTISHLLDMIKRKTPGMAPKPITFDDIGKEWE